MADASVNIKKLDLRTARNAKILLQIDEFTSYLIHIFYVRIFILIDILSHTCEYSDFYCIC